MNEQQRKLRGEEAMSDYWLRLAQGVKRSAGEPFSLDPVS